MKDITAKRTHCVIGPSHFMDATMRKAQSAYLFNDVTVHSRYGLANWSGDILKWIEDAYTNGDEVTWFVSNWLFNNKDINEIKGLQNGELCLPGARGLPKNIDKTFSTPEHTSFLAKHTLKIIDYVIGKYPNIKLVFWCLYHRTNNVGSRTIAKEHTYAAMLAKYTNNCIDIDYELKIMNLKFGECIIDQGAHPNHNGYKVIKNWISR